MKHNIIRRTARNYLLKRNGSDETLSEISVEDYNILSTNTRRCFSENNTAVEEVKQLRFSVAQVEALTNASQEDMLKLYNKFAEENSRPELENKTKIIKSTFDITPIDDDDDPKVLSRYKEQSFEEKHLNYLSYVTENDIRIHKDTTKPLVMKDFSVESVVYPFSYNSDDTHLENDTLTSESSSTVRSHPYFTRSQGSVNSQSTTHGSVQSPFSSQDSTSRNTSQEPEHSNHSDSNNSDTNNNYNNLDATENDFSING